MSNTNIHELSKKHSNKTLHSLKLKEQLERDYNVC